MTGILKVDTIQKNNGATPTASDLGLNISGNIVQTVQVKKTDTSVISGSSYSAVPGLNITITPKYTNSQFLISLTLSALPTSPGYHGAVARLVRNGTALILSDATDRPQTTFSLYRDADSDGNTIKLYNYNYIDSISSPAGTSITYGIQVADLNSASEPIYINRSQTDSTGSVHPRATSTIIVMEIAA